MKKRHWIAVVLLVLGIVSVELVATRANRGDPACDKDGGNWHFFDARTDDPRNCRR